MSATHCPVCRIRLIRSTQTLAKLLQPPSKTSGEHFKSKTILYCPKCTRVMEPKPE